MSRRTREEYTKIVQAHLLSNIPSGHYFDCESESDFAALPCLMETVSEALQRTFSKKIISEKSIYFFDAADTYSISRADCHGVLRAVHHEYSTLSSSMPWDLDKIWIFSELNKRCINSFLMAVRNVYVTGGVIFVVRKLSDSNPLTQYFNIYHNPELKNIYSFYEKKIFFGGINALSAVSVRDPMPSTSRNFEFAAHAVNAINPGAPASDALHHQLNTFFTANRILFTRSVKHQLQISFPGLSFDEENSIMKTRSLSPQQCEWLLADLTFWKNNHSVVPLCNISSRLENFNQTFPDAEAQNQFLQIKHFIERPDSAKGEFVTIPAEREDWRAALVVSSAKALLSHFSTVSIITPELTQKALESLPFEKNQAFIFHGMDLQVQTDIFMKTTIHARDHGGAVLVISQFNLSNVFNEGITLTLKENEKRFVRRANEFFGAKESAQSKYTGAAATPLPDSTSFAHDLTPLKNKWTECRNQGILTDIIIKSLKNGASGLMLTTTGELDEASCRLTKEQLIKLCDDLSFYRDNHTVMTPENINNCLENYQRTSPAQEKLFHEAAQFIAHCTTTPQDLWISGDAGIGKSHLLFSTAKALHAQGHPVVIVTEDNIRSIAPKLWSPDGKLPFVASGQIWFIDDFNNAFNFDWKRVFLNLVSYRFQNKLAISIFVTSNVSKNSIFEILDVRMVEQKITPIAALAQKSQMALAAAADSPVNDSARLTTAIAPQLSKKVSARDPGASAGGTVNAAAAATIASTNFAEPDQLKSTIDSHADKPPATKNTYANSSSVHWRQTDKKIVKAHLDSEHSSHSFFTDASAKRLLSHLKKCYRQDASKQNYIREIAPHLTEYETTLKHLARYERDHFTPLSSFDRHGNIISEDIAISEIFNLVAACVLHHNDSDSDKADRIQTLKNCLMDIQTEVAKNQRFCSSGIRNLLVFSIAACFSPCKLLLIDMRRIDYDKRNALAFQGNVLLLLSDNGEYKVGFLNEANRYRETALTLGEHTAKIHAAEHLSELVDLNVIQHVDNFLSQFAPYRPLQGIPVIENFEGWILAHISRFYLAALQKKSDTEQYQLVLHWAEVSVDTEVVIQAQLQEWLLSLQPEMLCYFQEKLTAMGLWGASSKDIVDKYLYHDAESKIPDLPSTDPVMNAVAKILVQHASLAKHNQLLRRITQAALHTFHEPGQTLLTLDRLGVTRLWQALSWYIAFLEHHNVIRVFECPEINACYNSLISKLEASLQEGRLAPTITAEDEDQICKAQKALTIFLKNDQCVLITDFFALLKTGARENKLTIYQRAEAIFSTKISFEKLDIAHIQEENGLIILNPYLLNRIILHAVFTEVHEWRQGFIYYLTQVMLAIAGNFSEPHCFLVSSLIDNFLPNVLEFLRMTVKMREIATKTPAPHALAASLYEIMSCDVVIDLTHVQYCALKIAAHLATLTVEERIAFLLSEVPVSSDFILPDTSIRIFSILLFALQKISKYPDKKIIIETISQIIPCDSRIVLRMDEKDVRNLSHVLYKYPIDNFIKLYIEVITKLDDFLWGPTFSLACTQLQDEGILNIIATGITCFSSREALVQFVSEKQYSNNTFCENIFMQLSDTEFMSAKGHTLVDLILSIIKTMSYIYIPARRAGQISPPVFLNFDRNNDLKSKKLFRAITMIACYLSGQSFSPVILAREEEKKQARKTLEACANTVSTPTALENFNVFLYFLFYVPPNELDDDFEINARHYSRPDYITENPFLSKATYAIATKNTKGKFHTLTLLREKIEEIKPCPGLRELRNQLVMAQNTLELSIGQYCLSEIINTINQLPAARPLPPQWVFLVKTIASENWPEFARELTNTNYRPEKRQERDRKRFTLRVNSGRHEVVSTRKSERTSLLSKHEKGTHTRHQSTTAAYVGPGAQKYVPLFFQRDTAEAESVGMAFNAEGMPVNFIKMYEAPAGTHGTHNRSKDYSTKIEAELSLLMLINQALCFRTVDELIRTQFSNRNLATNEVLAYLCFTLGASIMIFTDNLNSRLLAQMRAADLSRALEQNGHPDAQAVIPIKFYDFGVFRAEPGFREYTLREQEMDSRCTDEKSPAYPWTLAVGLAKGTVRAEDIPPQCIEKVEKIRGMKITQ